MCSSASRDKIQKLVEVVRKALHPGCKVLVFIRTKRQTEYVASKLLAANLPAETLHSDKVCAPTCTMRSRCGVRVANVLLIGRKTCRISVRATK